MFIYLCTYLGQLDVKRWIIDGLIHRSPLVLTTCFFLWAALMSLRKSLASTILGRQLMFCLFIGSTSYALSSTRNQIFLKRLWSGHYGDDHPSNHFEIIYKHFLGQVSVFISILLTMSVYIQTTKADFHITHFLIYRNIDLWMS